MGAEVKIEGFEELSRKLKEIPVVLAKRVLRNALAAGARVVQKDAKRNAPVLSLAGAVKAPYRKPGTVRDAIRVRTSKDARKSGNVGVFVNVKPLSGEKVTRLRVFKQRGRLVTQGHQAVKGSGADSRDDPYYWRWLEFGWNPNGGRRTAKQRGKHRRVQGTKIQGKKFLSNAAKKLPEALEIFKAALTKWINKTNASGKVQ